MLESLSGGAIPLQQLGDASPTADLAAALVKAQAEFHDPTKDATNPHFKSKFVSLKGVLEAVRPALHKHGLAITQEIDFDGDRTFVRTRLLHASGQSLESRCPVIAVKQNDPQAMGSAITYARRYGAAAICGIAPSDEDDDDGESAARAPQKPATAPRKPAAPSSTEAAPEPYETFEEALDDIAKATNVLRLSVIGASIKVSKFGPTESDELKTAWADKRKELA